jgi:hypothetical protein
VTDRHHIARLEQAIENSIDLETAYVDARNEAVNALVRWADGDPSAREDWLHAIDRMTRARAERAEGLQELERARDKAMQE